MLDEMHSNALITSEVHTRRPIGRLADRVPSLEDGSVALLPDGRMRVTYNLRKEVSWHDGQPFTAQDLVFSQRIQSDTNVPLWRVEGAKEMEASEAPDDSTFMVTFGRPYYRGATLGLLGFWPVPRHILGPLYERYLATGVADDIVNSPYWSAEYVHLGPFRVAQYDPAEGFTFEAHDRFFLGRPKIDVVRARVFTDQGTLFSNLLAGTVDMVPDLALIAERGAQLKEQWEGSGAGVVHIRGGAPYVLTPQFRAAFQREAANLDLSVRAALYHALDREAISEAVNGGQRDLAAWSILARTDELYEPTRDTLRRYAYSTDRARALLRDAGWTPGPDGVLRHASDGRRYQTQMTATPGREREMALLASFWRQVGVEVEEIPMTPVLVRDRERRAQFPGWEATGAGAGHSILDVFGPPAANAPNRWVGNRPGYEDPRAQPLIDALRGSPTQQAHAQAMRSISEYVAAELPILMLYHLADYLGVRRGVTALDDLAGGQGANPIYGSYSRNAHLWDVQ
jgi:peptide/nickel transport system substrate-binding protein